MQLRSRLFITPDAAAVLLIVLLWCRAVGARIALSLTADKVFVPVGEEPIWPRAASLISSLSFLLAVGISVAIILFRINEITRPGLWRIAVLLAPWVVIMVPVLYSGSPTSESVLYLLVVLALAALRPSPRVLIALGVLVVLTAIIAIAFGFLMPDAGRVRDADGTVASASTRRCSLRLDCCRECLPRKTFWACIFLSGSQRWSCSRGGGCGSLPWQSSGSPSVGPPVAMPCWRRH